MVESCELFAGVLVAVLMLVAALENLGGGGGGGGAWKNEEDTKIKVRLLSVN